MDSFIQDDEECCFFDALEHVTQEPDLLPNYPSTKNWDYDVWINIPQSVCERRNDENDKNDVFIGEIDRIMDNNGAVLRTSGLDHNLSSSCSSVSSWTTDDSDLPHLNKCPSREFEQVSQLSCSVNRIHREIEDNNNSNNCYTPRTMDKLKNKWLSKWRSMTCMIKSSVKDDSAGPDSFGRRISRVRVRHCQRKSKELSALYAGQDIRAHDGSILTMKFSHDGRYLASGGEDRIVRVWKIIEDERSDTIDVPDEDPSCVYFSVNRLSELGPLMVEKDNNKVNKLKGLRKTPDSACVIFPPKVFRILEEPLHVFEGHSGDILDLSWSKNNCLLSSSVDKTVRLWRVGDDRCLKMFSHTDYVTCVQFNPVNDDYFISGSIDGKVRIWTINGCQVVDWVETRDIISAVSYRPDGQGGIIGSICGTCRFFNLSDNHFQLETQMCLAGKKKSTCKRITGFQFLPQDPTKVLVTCADSHVRIIDGLNVIGKYKGLRNAGNQISASFTSDGKHVISASEDSNIYVWNYNDQPDSSFSNPKVVKSFECFSSDASIAIPWCGLKSSGLHETINSLPFSSSTCFSLSQEFLLDAGPKGSATWPEEKLLSFSSPKAGKSPMGKSQYKLFRTSCRSSSSSHAWGLVIVTAGWDGRIRSFHNYGLPVPL
ncbi:WD repeat-containing protein 44 [Phtheirospermum japonicum]|uniref:WD repeat-containing protein 44 n=1 Tax=Phtheirospermum japonicum TaxID=374723 RepID=A0A830CFS4_9LAMI|nr:WD repeat-containing protein 44 [Phtheirospermum japonicum]